MEELKETNTILNDYSAKLTATSIFEHVWLAIKKHYILFLGSSSGLFLTLTGINAIFNIKPTIFTDLTFNLALAILSILLAALYTGRNYVNTSPDNFENEKSDIRKLVQLKRPKWESKLAYALLNDRLSQIDDDLKDLIEGRKYVEIKRKPNDIEYWDWINLRLDNLNRMLDPMLNLLIYDLPKAMGTQGNSGASPSEILRTVEKIKILYQQTYDFEFEGHQIEPPELFKKVHRYQFGWTNVIRDSIKQMYIFLERVMHSNFKKNKSIRIDFQIKVDAPENLEKFTDELGKIDI